MAATVVVASVLSFAGPAYAHHPLISASATCDSKVNFTATAWEGDTDDPATPENEYELSRTNDQIEISYSVDGGQTFTALPHEETFRFSPANNFEFSGSFTPAAAAPDGVIVKATAKKPWGNGVRAGESRQTEPVPLPTDCALPTASISELECAEGGVTVTVTNPTQQPVVFTVTRDGTTVATPTVPPGETTEVPVPVAEGTTAVITATAPGIEPVTRTVTRDCEKPSASISDVVCSEGGVTVTLTNAGELPATFTVTKDGAAVDTRTVAPGESASVVVPVAEDTTAVIGVTAPGMEAATRTVDRDCEKPAASISDVVCAEGGVTVTLTNTGGELPVRFTVTKDGATVNSVEVGTAPRSVVVPVAEDTTAVIGVTAPGMAPVTRTVNRDCEPAAVVPTQVAGTTFTRAEPAAAPAATPAPAAAPPAVAGRVLAVTGADSGRLTVTAGALLGVGVLLVGAGRPRARRNDYIPLAQRLDELGY